MPIRFRCAYCNQLMGIARRKAGNVVRCPNCAGQVIVPNADGSDPGTGKAVQPGGRAAERPFEQNDFEEALHAAGGKRSAAAGSSPPPPAPSHKAKDGGGPYDSDQLEFPARLPASVEPPGIYLSPAMATLLSVALVVALALAFTAGLIVGRFLYAPSTQPANAPAGVTDSDR